MLGHAPESLSGSMGEHGQVDSYSHLDMGQVSGQWYHADTMLPRAPTPDRRPLAMKPLRRQGDAERRLALLVPTSVRETRRALHLTQAALATRIGLSQPQVSAVEGGDLGRLTVVEMGRLLDVLGVRLDLALHRPFIAGPSLQQDAAHARVLGYVAGRLRAMGWEVRLEVEIVEGRAHGWIDLVAYQPIQRALFVGEIKAGLDDVGAAQRQLGWYERAARGVAQSDGWRYDHAASALLVLATEANDRLVSANRVLIREAFPARAAGLWDWLNDASDSTEGRAIALVDSRSRRRHWPIPLALDGRRTRLRYSDYADFMRSASRSPRARRCP